MSARRLFLAALLTASIGLAACTGDGSSETTTPPAPPSDSALPTTDIGPVPFKDGEFAYSSEGIEAHLTWEGGDGTLSVTNDTAAEVGAPGLYAVTQSDAQVDATINDAAAIGPGDEATFDVSFPASLKPDDAGFIVLLLGHANYGALAPVKAE